MSGVWAPRGLLRVAAGLVVVAGVLAACGSTSSSSAPASSSSTAHRGSVPVAIVPVSAGALSLGPLQANGEFSVLAGTPSSKGVFTYQLSTRREVASFSVSNQATAITQLPNGVIAVGLGSGSVGAVDLESSSGQQLASIPVAAPVRGLALGTDGSTIYVLEGTGSTRAVAVLDTATRSAATTLPVNADTVAIASSPTQQELYGLESTGALDVYSTATGQRIGTFPVGHSGIAATLSPDGTALFVLKGVGGVRNVAVVNLSTEGDVRAIGAPAGGIAIAPTLTGADVLVLAVGPTSANVQELPTS